MILLLGLIAFHGASAQPSTTEGRPGPIGAAEAQAQEAGSEITVYLLTMGAGDQVWEKFGHNAIWIHDAARATDIAYNWGLFDFADADFIPRFMQGRMRYSMGAFDFAETVDAYRRANRSVTAQELNLSPPQRQRLAEFVAWNNRPENRNYHYDYFRDNCSTRVRDALNDALGGQIKAQSESMTTRTTYRFHTGRLTQDDWPVFTGTMIGLGEPTDRPISAYEEMFLPVRMMNRFRQMRVNGQPMVKNEQVLVQSTRTAEDVAVRRGMTGYLAIAAVVLVFGFLMLKLGRIDLVLSLATLWSIIAGLAGMLLVGLWGFTDHLYSYRNENVLQFTPLSFVVAWFLTRLIIARRSGSDKSEKRLALSLKFARIVAGLAVLGFVMQILPALNQVNGDVIALALPLHVGVIAALLSLSPRERVISEVF